MNTLYRNDALQHISIAGLACAVLLAVSGCASAPPPLSGENLAVAASAVQHASTPGTSHDAAQELQIAQSKLASAREAFGNKQYQRADELAEQAQIDSRVAELHAQSERSLRAAQESQAAAAALRDEINRSIRR